MPPRSDGRRFGNMPELIEEMNRQFFAGDSVSRRTPAEHANLMAIQQIFTALDENDFDAVADCYTEDIVHDFVSDPSETFTARIVGRDAVREQLLRNFSMVATHELSITRLFVASDRISVHIHETGRFLETNQPYDVHCRQVFRFRDGKVSHMTLEAFLSPEAE